MREKKTVWKLLIASCVTLLMVAPAGALALATQNPEVTTVSLLKSTASAPLFSPPSSFDLRNDGGHNYVSSVKDQTGGTCWTHGTMAALEGNLLITGNWNATGHPEEPNLAEYHLDWWNGFNSFNNDDAPGSGGLPVHEGGDYLIASAYLTRGDGAVYCAAANDNTEEDAAWYYSTPPRLNSSYQIFYPNDIEWFIAGSDLSNIDTIKETIMANGVMGTCIDYESQYMQYGSSYTFYQPPTSQTPPNHAVAIVGWDDAKVTQAPLPGAWICKNSWGDWWGPEGGYFWVSFYDKWSCQNPEMGAVSFQDVQLKPYNNTYYYDYHGWRDTLTDISEAFNAFVAKGNQTLKAVSFYTSSDAVGYEVKVYGRFEGGTLQDELSSVSGSIAYKGYHTIPLSTPVGLATGSHFYIYVKLLSGGQAIDRTSIVSTLLARNPGTEVKSAANPGESYYWTGSSWADLYNYNFHNLSRNNTANFCIKGFTVGGYTPKNPDLNGEGSLSWTGIKPGGTVHGNFTVENIGDPASLLDWKVAEWPSWGTWTFQPASGTGLTPEEGAIGVQVWVVAPPEKSEFNGTVKIVNIHDSNDFVVIPVYMKTPVIIPQSHLQLLWQFFQERLHQVIYRFFYR